MNNKLTSQLLRALKITTSYIMVLILFFVFALPVLSLARDNNEERIMLFFSFLLFMVLFASVYIEMRNIAFREKRPQYGINPPPYKGFFYGFAGMLPLSAIQLVLILIKVPEAFETLKRRIYQGFGGPLYWLSKILGDDPIHYILSFAALIPIAGLGYFAGYKEFYLVNAIRLKFGIKKSAQKK